MYPHQAERLGAARQAGGLDALVACSPANVAYLTGFRSLARAAEPATEIYAVAAGTGTALVVPAQEAAAVVEGEATADHVLCHGAFAYAEPAGGGETARRVRALAAEPAATAADALAAALARLGIRGGRIGLDDAALPAARAAALARRLEGYTLAPASAALAAARQVKGPWEIDCLRRALHLTEESLDAVLDLLRAGVTEREVATAFEHEAARRGGGCYRTIVAFGPGAAVPAPWPGERALRPGDLVRFDLGCDVQGHRSSLARMAVLGEPSARQEAVFDALHAGLDALLAAIAPGATGGHLFDTGLAAVRAGLDGFAAADLGHGIGLEPVEPPSLAPGDASLEIGMVLCPRVGWYAPGEAGIAVAETVLVTRAGAHVLNRSRRGLVVLD